MLPKYRRLVETLAQAGLLKVICGTDTLGVGINVPIRTVLFTGLSKYDGTKVRLLQAREFHQIAGRAGRAGFDTLGAVLVQAPEHVIENERALAKAGDDPSASGARWSAASRPRARSAWGKPTFERLVAAEPEPLALELHGHPLDAAQRVGPPRRRVRGDAPPSHRQSRRPGRAAAPHPPGDRHLPRAGGRRRGGAPARAGRRGPHRPAHRRPAARLRAQPAAVAVRAGHHRAARPGRRRPTTSTSLSVIESTLDNPRTGARRPAVQGARARRWRR